MHKNQDKPSRRSRSTRLRTVLLLATGSACLPVSSLTACPAPPPVVINLDLKRFYTDAKGTRIDTAIRAANAETTKPITSFLRAATKMADEALQTGGALHGHEQAACALSWMQIWAEGRALIGPMTSSAGQISKQGEHHRKWALAGLALTYLKLKPFAPDSHRATIEPWLKAMADDALALFDSPGIKRNNHWYWLGLGTGAVGLATGSKTHWKTAFGIFHDAMNDIAPDGTLPMELERGSRALSYHVFAVTPLVVLAELAAANGEDWYATSNGALHRLVAITARGLIEPATFEALSGAAQKTPIKPGYGWLNLYAARFPGRLGEPLPRVKSGYRWLGGDIRLLAQAAAAQRNR